MEPYVRNSCVVNDQDERSSQSPLVGQYKWTHKPHDEVARGSDRVKIPRNGSDDQISQRDKDNTLSEPQILSMRFGMRKGCNRLLISWYCRPPDLYSRAAQNSHSQFGRYVTWKFLVTKHRECKLVTSALQRWKPVVRKAGGHPQSGPPGGPLQSEDVPSGPCFR